MQKTAYEMRISDWSSDVCSSDLRPAAVDGALANTLALAAAGCAGACRPQRWRFLPITSRRTVHGHPPGIAMELPRHASRPAPQGAAGTFSLVVGWVTWPASAGEPGKPSGGGGEEDGRASGWERGCQYGLILVVAGFIKK